MFNQPISTNLAMSGTSNPNAGAAPRMDTVRTGPAFIAPRYDAMRPSQQSGARIADALGLGRARVRRDGAPTDALCEKLVYVPGPVFSLRPVRIPCPPAPPKPVEDPNRVCVEEVRWPAGTHGSSFPSVSFEVVPCKPEKGWCTIL
jgi:hypothetical protein